MQQSQFFVSAVDCSLSSVRRHSKSGKSSGSRKSGSGKYQKHLNQELNPESHQRSNNNTMNSSQQQQLQQQQQPQQQGEDDDQHQHPRNKWRCMQPRLCNYCWKTFSNSFNLKQHIVNVHIQSQGVTCNLCSKVVKNKWYLRKHLVTAHGAPLKRVKPETTGGGGSGGKKTGIGMPMSSSKNPLDMTLATAMAMASVNGDLARSKVGHHRVMTSEEEDD